jgi:hypothetical protein
MLPAVVQLVLPQEVSAGIAAESHGPGDVQKEAAQAM